MDSISIDKRKIILISLIVVFLIALVGSLFLAYKKENPRYTAYSCSKLFSFSDRALPSDKKIRVSSAKSMEEDLSLGSLVSGVIPSQGRIANLVNDSSKLVSLANQMKSDAETNYLTIPKNACYESVNTHDFDLVDLSLSQSQSPSIAVYSWVKTHKNYLSHEFNTINAVLIMDNHAVHVQINGPSNGGSSSLLALLSGFKTKLTVYSLNDAQD